MSDDFGDVGDFEEPIINVKTFLERTPRYGEQVALSLKTQMVARGAVLGKKLHTQLR